MQDTVGLTVAASVQMLFALVSISVFLFIIQKIGLGYHNYLAMDCTLLIAAFFLGLVGSQVHTLRHIQFASDFLFLLENLIFFIIETCIKVSSFKAYVITKISFRAFEKNAFSLV